MKSFDFTAEMVATVKGYVEAESEDEAMRMIKNGEYDDIYDDDIDEPISNIRITGCHDINEDD